jgi:calpain, invertebrate
MWEIMVKSRQHKSLIGASIAPNPRVKEARLSNGLVMGHAYTVTQVASLETGSREVHIIRVRNPWGNEVEWKGKIKRQKLKMIFRVRSQKNIFLIFRFLVG